MLKAVEFHNFKCLRDTTLPLSPCTLIVGPNGSGKTSALQAIEWKQVVRGRSLEQVRTTGSPADAPVRVRLVWSPHRGDQIAFTDFGFNSSQGWYGPMHRGVSGPPHAPDSPLGCPVTDVLAKTRVFSLDAGAIPGAHALTPRALLNPDGGNVVVVLDRLRDQHPERFGELNDEFARWLPEFDQVLFETPSEGHRALQVRTREGHHAIPAADVSQGTLLALAILTLAYLPEPPPIVGLEEPDRGIHPRLLRDVRDAMYRLAYPESCGEKRDPVQVIATTHSPYMLDLFRDHPEEVVIAEKVEGNVRFQRLGELPNLDEILEDSHLGDAWYSGILGGVPTNR